MGIRRHHFWQRTIKVGALLFLFQNINAQSFTLNGTIIGKDTGYATLLYFRDSIKQRQSETVVIKHGKFKFKGTVSGADFAQLYTDQISNSDGKKYGISLFIEPGVINIAFNDGEANKAVISGSKTQKEYDALIKYTNKESLELNRISTSYNSITSQLKDGLIDTKTAEEKRKEIDKIYNPIVRSKSNKELSYLKKHPSSYVSLLMLYTFVGRLPNDSIDVMYSALSELVKGSTLDYSFLAYNTRYRKATATEYPFDKLKMNEKAPPFTIYNTLTDDSMTLTYFKGAVVVLEFWGLYCFPCLKFNPLLEDIRKQYGKDKLKIISINSNQKREMPELISYITKNKLSEWIHVSMDTEVNQIKNLIFKGHFSNYSGLGVPRTVLIDKSGKVIYTNYGYSSEDLQTLKALIDKAVNENTK